MSTPNSMIIILPLLKCCKKLANATACVNCGNKHPNVADAKAVNLKQMLQPTQQDGSWQRPLTDGAQDQKL